jgi:type II secretory pathway pseudopilin PulG
MKRNYLTSRQKAYSLVEAIVALTILLTGLLVAVRVFPTLLDSSSRAADLTQASLLAQQKAAEILRDDDTSHSLAQAIALRSTPTEPVAWPGDPRFTYSFSGRSLLYSENDPIKGAPNVARVIVRYAKSYRSSEDVLYELRFYEP